MKKRIMRLISALVLLAMAFGAFPALAASGDITIFRRGMDGITDSLRAMAYYDSTLYIFTYGDKYYTWTRGAALAEYPLDHSFERGVGDEYTDFRSLIAGADGLYAILIDNVPVDGDAAKDGTTFGGARLCRLAFGADGAVSFDEGVALEWDDMTDSYDEYEYSREVRFPFIRGGTLAFTTYGDSERNDTVFAFDIETGACETLAVWAADAGPSIQGMCPYGDGRAIVASFAYESEEEPVIFYAVDLETGEATEAFRIRTKDYAVPMNLLYDEKGDALYYTLTGELYKVPGLDGKAAESVAAVQIDGWSDRPPALTEDGYFICSDYETVIARNTDPSARAETRLTVYTNYNQAMDGAYYAFAGAHPDVDVVVATSYEDITEAMMNRSDAVDIYTASVSSEDYAALFERGYLADLSGSAALTELVGEMYPAIRNMVMKDGALYALPVELYADCWSYNPKAAAKLGLSEEDIPKTWTELLQFLQKAPERVGDAEVKVFEAYMTVDDARYGLFYGMMRSYMAYLAKAEGAEMSFDNELLRGLVAEFDRIDFSRFGLLESYEEESGVVSYEDGAEGVLFNFYGDIGVYSYMGRSGQPLPMPLAFRDGTDPMISGYLTVAFVNPYSKNADLAVEYLEAAAGELQTYFLAAACPGRDEPIPNLYYEENLAYYEQQIESLRAELEKADEGAKADWQEQLDQWQGYYEEYRQYGAWDATAESIAAYRAYAVYIQPSEYFGLGGEGANDFYDNVRQYLDGAIDGNTMLTNIDKKLKMMLQEGL